MDNEYIKILQNGGIGIMPSDTVYGMFGSALKQDTVERIYDVRNRELTKPFIILISDANQPEHFNVLLDDLGKAMLDKVWPGPVSVVLPCAVERFEYLHRGKNALAFRVPKNEELLEILRVTGPLVAPSANMSGVEVVRDIDEAWNVFGDKVDFYKDGGRVEGEPSTLVEIIDWKFVVLRQGVFDMSTIS